MNLEELLLGLLTDTRPRYGVPLPKATEDWLDRMTAKHRPNN